MKYKVNYIIFIIIIYIHTNFGIQVTILSGHVSYSRLCGTVILALHNHAKTMSPFTVKKYRRKLNDRKGAYL